MRNVTTDGVRHATRGTRLRLFVFATGLTLLSRLPLLTASYGDDEDAWLVVQTVQTFATTGRYTPSRMPGYPLPELVYGLLGTTEPLLMNGLTALLGAIGIGFFALTICRLGGRDALLAALALAFTPVVFVASTTVLDYIWELAFILISLYLVLQERPLLAGLALGLGIGCRITAGLLLLPLALLLGMQEHHAGRRGWGRLLAFAAIALLTGTLAFLPIYAQYGTAFLTFDNDQPMPLSKVLYRFVVEVWGLVGAAGIACIAAVAAYRWVWRRRNDRPAALPLASWSQAAVWLLALGLYVLAFARLPHEGSYLIPAIPFVILLAGRLLERQSFQALCAVLLAAPLFFGIARPHNLGGTAISAQAIPLTLASEQLAIEPLRGPIVIDQQRRLRQAELAHEIVARADDLPCDSVIVVDWLWPTIAFALRQHEATNGPLCHHQWVYDLNEVQIRAVVASGTPVYYLPLPDVLAYVDFDPAHTLAQPLWSE